MKKLANLNGAKALNKKEQQSINGGAPPGTCCDPANDCCVWVSWTGCKYAFSTFPMCI